jgi:hypothetical protein
MQQTIESLRGQVSQLMERVGELEQKQQMDEPRSSSPQKRGGQAG